MSCRYDDHDDHAEFYIKMKGLDSDTDTDQSPVIALQEKLTHNSLKCKQEFKAPMHETKLTSLFNKQFASETIKKLKWGIKMYTEWRDACNKNLDLALIQADLNDLSTLTKRNLSYALYRFVTEIKKLDGSDYPLHTLYRIVIGIQMYLETQGVNWQLTNDPEFKNVHFTVDNVMKHCTSQGLGTIVNQAQILSYDQEELLWQQ